MERIYKTWVCMLCGNISTSNFQLDGEVCLCPESYLKVLKHAAKDEILALLRVAMEHQERARTWVREFKNQRDMNKESVVEALNCVALAKDLLAS
jgi:hypothetical protein